MRRADRLFLDANVLFSAAYRADAGVQGLWQVEEAVLLSSAYAVEEARRNLGSKDQLGRLQQLLMDVKISDVRASQKDRAEIEESGLPEKDLPILEAAAGSQATHLITGDRKHFGHLYGSRVAGAQILRPADYVAYRRQQ